jgi:hypothetical protein
VEGTRHFSLDEKNLCLSVCDDGGVFLLVWGSCICVIFWVSNYIVVTLFFVKSFFSFHSWLFCHLPFSLHSWLFCPFLFSLTGRHPAQHWLHHRHRRLRWRGDETRIESLAAAVQILSAGQETESLHWTVVCHQSLHCHRPHYYKCRFWGIVLNSIARLFCLLTYLLFAVLFLYYFWNLDLVSVLFPFRFPIHC